MNLKNHIILIFLLGIVCYQTAAAGGKKGDNSVQINMSRGLDAYMNGNHRAAALYLDNALLRIETIFADNENSYKARSLWYEEGMKDFKGEPYERAMAYFYRSLLYIEERDFENARASLKSGILQDAFAEEDQNRTDFALLIFLEGWASYFNGDKELAQAAFDEARTLRPDFESLDVNNFPYNALIIVETGKSPRKVADGVGHYQLKFRRGKKFKENRVKISIDENREVDLYPMEDIFWQASSRGGRPVDKILKGKAVFRDVGSGIGTVLTQLSDDYTTESLYHSGKEAERMDEIGLALGLAGVAALAISSRANPKADTRYWDNLPDAVHVYPVNFTNGTHDIALTFHEKSGGKVQGLDSRHSIRFDESSAGEIYMFRSRERISRHLKK